LGKTGEGIDLMVLLAIGSEEKIKNLDHEEPGKLYQSEG